MATSDSFLKAYLLQESAQIVERYICIGGPAQNLKQKFTVLAHPC
ncbi:MAG TPA: hypothetical protein VGO68_01795 [Pyrinomonadaceae bacterium]|nr:hypothetical protein [Pyrinomonadaceae bacterium]